MKTLGPYVVTRTLREGPVVTLAGVDRLTGLDTVMYLVPGDVFLPNLNHPNLLGYSDLGLWSDGMYAVSNLPPGSVLASSARDVAKGVLDALVWLHSHDLVHGGLTPQQVWAVAGGVVLTGAGLPWRDLSGGFDAPEGGKGPAADLYALGRVLEELGEVPSGLSRLLSPDPQARGTAFEALALLRTPSIATTVTLTPAHFQPPAEPVVPDLPGPNLPTEGTVAATAPLEDVEESVVVVTPQRVAKDRPAIPYGWNDVKREAPPKREKREVAASVTSEPMPPSPRSQPIRIGWEEDHSWRVVKPGRPPSPEEDRRPLWLLPVALAAVLLVMIALGWSLRGTPAACCDVRFTVRGEATSAVVSVVRAPAGSGLKVGQRLGSIPGTIRFPNTSGAYRVRVDAPGFERGELELRLPRDRQALVELKR